MRVARIERAASHDIAHGEELGSQFQSRKELSMSIQENNRVLVRRGARELTVNEAERVLGAGDFNTLVCTIPLSAAFATSTHTGPGDGDACGDTDHDL